MFVCIYTDENGFDIFGQGETLDDAFHSLGHDDMDIELELENGSLRFFEPLDVEHQYMPTFTKA